MLHSFIYCCTDIIDKMIEISSPVILLEEARKVVFDRINNEKYMKDVSSFMDYTKLKEIDEKISLHLQNIVSELVLK